MINQADAGWAEKVSIGEQNFIPFSRGDDKRFQMHIETNAISMEKQPI
jgi:hypothetical protein